MAIFKFNKAVAIGVLALALSACSFVKVYSAADKGEPPSGHVDGIKGIVANDQEPLTMVFVHGVGDHCRGYAVGDESQSKVTAAAWLNNDTNARIGLIPMADRPQLDDEISSDELQIGDPNQRGVNVILLRRRDFQWRLSGRKQPLEVHAWEITWSPITRWIKNSMLGYDASGVELFSSLNSGRAINLCTKTDPSDTIGSENPMASGFSPPDRLWLNAMLKWGVLDRSLSDALIYTGTYGEAMQRGVAAALCRIVAKPTPDFLHRPDAKRGRFEKTCDWDGAYIDLQSHYVFVTHSLGSRMLYDTLLALSKANRVSAKDWTVVQNGKVKAERSANEMLMRTAGIYMMANQVTLLGLGKVPIDAPFNQEHPYAERLGQQPTDKQVDPSKSDALFQLLVNRKRILAEQVGNDAEPTPNLPIISFNDTNDLLTWHLPAWYATPEVDPAYHVKIADVYLQNSVHLVELFEWPPKAHDGYFKNPRVLDVMLCGADHGHVDQCAK